MARELYKLRDKIKEIKIYCEQIQSENLAYLEESNQDESNNYHTFDYYEAKLELTAEILILLEGEL